MLSSSSGSSNSTSAVSYPVTLTLDQGGSKLKAGMSASADIVTARASGLVVPTQALTGTTVTVVRGGKRSRQVVETGLAGDSTTEILTGLNAGDQVAVRSTSALAGASGSAASPAGGQAGAGFGNRLRGGAGGFGGGGFGGGGLGGVAPGGGLRGGGGPP